MKRKIISIIGIILIIVGIGILAVTGYMKYTTYKKQAILRENFEHNVNVKDVDSKDKNKKEDKDTSKDETDLNKVKAIGILKIPKIDINVAIGEGVGENILRYAIGHFPESAMPGQDGNCCLAGHRNFTYAEYFKDLDKLKEGDKIIIQTKKNEYTYIVTKSFIVDPEETEVLDSTKDSTITLVTCTIGAKQRLIVKGKLQE